MTPTRLIFSSTRSDSNSETVDAILRVSRTNNVRDGVTGVLIVGERQFVQLLEGDRASVSRCFLRITKDPRHRDLQVISTGDVPHRLFAGHSMQRIDLFSVRSSVLERYLINGAFEPSWMPHAAIDQFFRELSERGWRDTPSLRDSEQNAETLARLRRVHQVARHVLDDNVGSRRLGHDKLEQLQASILRQTAEAQALQNRLDGLEASKAQRDELASLIAYFDMIAEEIAQQLSA